jgi:hypothetical protein
MDSLEFLANVIRSLAWPTAVIVVILIFRKEVSLLVDRLRKFGLFGMRGEFAEPLKEGMEPSRKITIRGAKPKIEPPLTSDLPNEDVIAAFEEIENTLEHIRPLVDENLPTYRSIVERLERERYIEPEALQLFNSLREARNAAAQPAGSVQISTADAIEYQQQATLLNDVFEDALRRLKEAPSPAPAQPLPSPRPLEVRANTYYYRL